MISCLWPVLLTDLDFKCWFCSLTWSFALLLLANCCLSSSFLQRGLYSLPLFMCRFFNVWSRLLSSFFSRSTSVDSSNVKPKLYPQWETHWGFHNLNILDCYFFTSASSYNVLNHSILILLAVSWMIHTPEVSMLILWYIWKFYSVLTLVTSSDHWPT